MQEYLSEARGETKLKILIEYTSKMNPKIFGRITSDIKASYKSELDELSKK
jgi:hypothetical protein